MKECWREIDPPLQLGKLNIFQVKKGCDYVITQFLTRAPSLHLPWESNCPQNLNSWKIRHDHQYMHCSLFIVHCCLYPGYEMWLPLQHLFEACRLVGLHSGSQVGSVLMSKLDSRGYRCWIGHSRCNFLDFSFAHHRSSTTPNFHCARFFSSDLMITTSPLDR